VSNTLKTAGGGRLGARSSMGSRARPHQFLCSLATLAAACLGDVPDKTRVPGLRQPDIRMQMVNITVFSSLLSRTRTRGTFAESSKATAVAAVPARAVAW
jgi:hypothetical protein